MTNLADPATALYLAKVMTYAKYMPDVETVARTDAGLASELRMCVVRLRRRLVNERHPDNTLSISAMAVLGCLARRGEPMQIGELAEHERVRPPSMTRTVNALEQDGYVVRRQDANDARLVLVELSEKGRATVLADRRRRDAWLARQLRTLESDERETLRQAVTILQRLANQ